MKTVVLLNLIWLLFNPPFSSTNISLLTGSENGAKSWHLYSQTPDNETASCKKITSDNRYMFYANGTFEFDHGAITDDPSCKDDCCNDLLNITGTWTFTDNESGIKITGLSEKGNPSNTFNLLLFDATISNLTEDTFTLSQADSDTGEIHSFIFKKK